MRISDWSSDVCSSDLAEGISIDWLLETHAHADHLSAAPWLQKRLGGAIAIGEHIRDVQAVFGDIFNAGADFRRDGSDFDRSEEHTSELQSLMRISYAVFCLKKKKK